jgi:magnesium-transporting ATPase (P-type)
LLFLTACIAAIQQYQGDSISELLKKAIPQKASVLRGGKLQAIPVVEVVPGDILHLRIVSPAL